MWVVLTLAYLAAAIALFAGVSRLVRIGNPLVKFLGASGLCGVGLALHCLATFGLGTKMLAALLLYSCICELYIFLFGMVSSSVSASLLLALRQASLTDVQIEERYSNEYMVGNRLAKLERTGLLARDGAGYMLTAKGRLLVRRFSALRRFFRHGAHVDGAGDTARAPTLSPGTAARADVQD
jgi:hypothetical protein